MANTAIVAQLPSASAPLVRASLGVMAAASLFFNGISSFAAAAVLIALIIDHVEQRRSASGRLRPPAADLALVAIFLMAFAGATCSALLILGTPGLDEARAWRNLGNLVLISLLPLLLTLRWHASRLAVMAVRADMSGVMLASMGLVAVYFLTTWAGLTPDPAWLPNQFNRAIMHLAIFGWVVAAAAGPAGKPRKAIWLIAGLIVLALVSESASSALAMGVGCVAFFGCLTFGRSWIRLQTAAVVLATLLTLPAALFMLPPDDSQLGWLPFSWAERVAIWEEVADKCLMRPVFGWGMKASDLLHWTILPDYARFAGRPITHAHNATLQIIADLGLVGLAAWGLLLTLVGLRIGRLHRNLRPYAAAAYVSAVIVANLAIEIWTDSFLALLALSAILFRFLSLGMSGDNLTFSFARRMP